MRIAFTPNDNNKYKKTNIIFDAGLTPKMMHEIRTADVLKISDRLELKGIPTDFKDNQIIAWCCDKAIGILEQINQRFGTNLSFPRYIAAEKFEHLDIDTPHAYGFCNLTPSPLIKGSDDNIPSRIVFFNPEHDWSKIDSIADANYASRHSSTDFFLYTFLHEFTHVAHEDHMLEKFNGKTVLKKILSAKDLKRVREYQRKYGGKISQICNYALTDPLEAVACDMPVRIIASLDKESLTPVRNPFTETPYEKLHFWQKPKYPNEDKRQLQEILRRFWNGQFD